MAPLAPLECEIFLLAIHLASLQLQIVLDIDFHNFLKNQRHSWLEFRLKYKEPPLNLDPGKVNNWRLNTIVYSIFIHSSQCKLLTFDITVQNPVKLCFVLNLWKFVDQLRHELVGDLAFGQICANFNQGHILFKIQKLFKFTSCLHHFLHRASTHLILSLYLSSLHLWLVDDVSKSYF